MGQTLGRYKLLERVSEGGCGVVYVAEQTERGRISANIYLRRIHNFALAMNWVPVPVIPKRQWPGVVFKDNCVQFLSRVTPITKLNAQALSPSPRFRGRH